MNLLDIAYIQGSKAKEEKERERERARGSYIYIRYSNIYKSSYAKGNIYSNKSGDNIGAIYIVISQVAT